MSKPTRVVEERRREGWPSRALAVLAACALAACEGDQGPAGPAGPSGEEEIPDADPTRTAYDSGEPVPGLIVRIDALGGGSGPEGAFLAGDVPSVDFSLAKENGDPWRLDELVEGEALVSGPTFNYQRVLPAASDVLRLARRLGAGRHRYTFADPFPASYLPPYNDTTSFGLGEGELAGRALFDGTYTLGLSFTWHYTVEGRSFRRVGEATLDFRFGTSTNALVPRAATSAEHCARCHGELQAHDGRYRRLELCVLCHTSGAEDANLPDVAGGTPGVTIDARALFHKIHAGRFLPSVNGLAVDIFGSRIYSGEPTLLRYARSDGTLRDHSHAGFPALPNRFLPMPRDTGFEALPPEAQRAEDMVRSGPTGCAVCHGDPDGQGPIRTPAQAQLTRLPSRRACGACHDDWNPKQSYYSNFQSMPAQANDGGCPSCHSAQSPHALSPITAHEHPLDRATFDAGVNVASLALFEDGASDGDGSLEPGEGLALEFALTDDAGTPLAPGALSELRVVLAGPSSNSQVLYAAPVPTALVESGAPHRLRLPERIELEFVGDSSESLDVFQTSRQRHHLATGVTTDLLVRTATQGGASQLVASAARHDAFVDVADGEGFARGDVVVIEDGAVGREEYVRILLVEAHERSTRLWLSAPGQVDSGPTLRGAHPAGSSVQEVVLAPRSRPTHYTINPGTGTITERREFGAEAAVLVSYTSDYVFPDEYPQALNGSRDLDDRQGKWTGKPLVPGTYVASVSAARRLDFSVFTTVTTYVSSSPEATLPFLVGDAFELEPGPLLVERASCNACHQDLAYHDGLYRGLGTCLLCHGSGSEDLSRSTAANAPETRGLSVEFRTLVHRIHRGRELSDPTFEVVGAGQASYPDNFTAHVYRGSSTLPAFPGRTLECARCHGEGNDAALLPREREHPSAQENEPQIWRPVCSGCHDAEAELAHFDSNTAPDGTEACSVCHARGRIADALTAHGSRLEPR